MTHTWHATTIIRPTAIERMEQAMTAYKLTHYGRTDVDAFGRPYLTPSQITEIRETKNRAPVSVETMLMKVGF